MVKTQIRKKKSQIRKIQRHGFQMVVRTLSNSSNPENENLTVTARRESFKDLQIKSTERSESRFQRKSPTPATGRISKMPLPIRMKIGGERLWDGYYRKRWVFL